MKYFKYCPYCKNVLEWKDIEGRKRLFCTGCKWINYINPAPVVACLVKNASGGLLLVLRGIEPCVGEWALPGGFIELDESVQEAGARELKEETGLSGVPGRTVGIHVHESRTYGSVLMVGVEYLVKDFDLTPGDDAKDAKFFPQVDVPELPFSSHNYLVKKFLD